MNYIYLVDKRCEKNCKTQCGWTFGGKRLCIFYDFNNIYFVHDEAMGLHLRRFYTKHKYTYIYIYSQNKL